MTTDTIHPSAEDIVRFVRGDGDVSEAFRTHVSGCSSCARELAREARLELELEQIAASVEFCRSCGRIVRDQRCEHCGAALRPGGFVVERIIVQTANGRVYLARDEDGNQVALKELVFTKVPDVTTLTSFEREARLLQQLAHPGIPKFVKSFTEGEGVHTRLYLAQEYVAGVSLSERLEKHRFDEAEILQLAGSVLEILVYLQSISPPIFHRDVKPANLVVRPDGSVVLVDFGAARDVGATGGASLVGTFGYMPPEQLVGIVDSTSDLYGLGATLAHVATRRPPWQIFAKSEPLASATLSPGVRKWLLRLCAQRPDDRFENAEAARAALKCVNKAEPARSWQLPVALVAVVLTGAMAAALGVGILGQEDTTQVVVARPAPIVARPRPAPPPRAVPTPLSSIPSRRPSPQRPVRPERVVSPEVRTAPPPRPPPVVPPKKRVKRKKGRTRAKTVKQAFDLGSRALVMGTYEESKKHLLDCIRLDERYAKCHRALGVLYARQDRITQSIRHYRRYVELAPNASDAARVRQMIGEASSQP